VSWEEEEVGQGDRGEERAEEEKADGRGGEGGPGCGEPFDDCWEGRVSRLLWLGEVSGRVLCGVRRLMMLSGKGIPYALSPRMRTVTRSWITRRENQKILLLDSLVSILFLSEYRPCLRCFKSKRRVARISIVWYTNIQSTMGPVVWALQARRSTR
jgi:hypothetical protein